LKSETPEILFIVTLILLIEKMTLASRYDKFNQENTYQTSSELASFCKRYDKTFWCVIRFNVV